MSELVRSSAIRLTYGEKFRLFDAEGMCGWSWNGSDEKEIARRFRIIDKTHGTDYLCFVINKLETKNHKHIQAAITYVSRKSDKLKFFSNHKTVTQKRMKLLKRSSRAFEILSDSYDSIREALCNVLSARYRVHTPMLDEINCLEDDICPPIDWTNTPSDSIYRLISDEYARVKDKHTWTRIMKKSSSRSSIHIIAAVKFATIHIKDGDVTSSLMEDMPMLTRRPSLIRRSVG